MTRSACIVEWDGPELVLCIPRAVVPAHDARMAERRDNWPRLLEPVHPFQGLACLEDLQDWALEEEEWQ
jgi:hypothetical protein